MLKLKGPRLFLRPLTEGDATAAYVGWLNDPEVNRFLEVRHRRHTVESCRQFILASNESDDQHLFGIFVTESGQHIGNIKVGFVDRRNGTAQVSLLIGEKSCWGRSYGTEAIRLATDYGFRELKMDRLEAGCYEENLRSLRAFLRLGYSVEGFHRRKYVVDGKRTGSFWIGILRDEWDRDSI